MVVLNEEQIQDELKTRSDWSDVNGAIQRTFQFKDFDAAIGFVNRIAGLAEQAQHHPDILIRYNKVTLTLSTHDAGGVTSKDFDLAAKADAAA